MSILSDIDDGFRDFKYGFTGVTSANAIEKAAEIAAQYGRDGITQVDEAQRRLEETLAPFVQFGEQNIGNLEQLYQGNVADSIAASPTLQAINQYASEQVNDNPFLSNLDPSGLEQNQLISGIDLLSRERGDILSAVNLGQASAAQEAASNLQTGANRADLLSQIGNVTAAGGIGAANAYAQGGQNIANAGLSLAGLFSGRG